MTSNTSSTCRLYIERFPESLHQALRLEAVLRNSTMKAIVEAAVMKAIAEGQHAQPVTATDSGFGR